MSPDALPDQPEPRWRAEHFDATVIAHTLAPLYSPIPTMAVDGMQPVNPVDLVEHVLHEAEKQITSPSPDENNANTEGS